MTQVMIETAPAGKEKKLTGWQVLLIFLGFFGVIFAVNGVFLYNAITSFPGEDVEKSYLQGLNYNQTLDARAAQAELGWQAQAGIESGKMVFMLQDATGQDLSGYPVIVEARRLTSDAEDQVLTLKSIGAGEYQASVDALTSGQWRMDITVLDFDAETTVFQARKDLRVP